MWPELLHPTDRVPIGSEQVGICRPSFRAWNGPTTGDTFGGKDLLDVDGRPQFGEVAILQAFEKAGWQGRWVETYGRPRMDPGLWKAWRPGGQKVQEQIPIETAWVAERLIAIAEANDSTYAGCWDVVAWTKDRMVFAESKKNRKDRIRSTQIRWMEAALRCGSRPEDFVVVEWSMY